MEAMGHGKFGSCETRRMGLMVGFCDLFGLRYGLILMRDDGNDSLGLSTLVILVSIIRDCYYVFLVGNALSIDTFGRAD